MAFATRRNAVDPTARFGALLSAGAAAAAVAGLVIVTVITYVSVIPPIQDDLAPRFGAPPVVDTGEALLSFTRAGLLSAFALLAPPALRWDGASSAGARTLQPSADFAAVATAATYDLALVPGPLAGLACPYVANVTFDARGFADTCASAPAPGTPLGSATLDATGVLPFAQLPPFLYAGPTFLGYWNAANNTPFLSNASCGAGDKFYYVVSDAGATPLGPHSDWHPLDQVVCFNGTWDHVALAAVDSIFGRMGVVVAEYADYSSALVEHAGAPLADTLNASFVTLGPSAGLPGAVSLSVVAGEMTQTGAALGLPAVPAFPAANNTVGGYPKNPVVDHQGRWVYTDVGVPVETIAGTPDQIASACVGHTCTLSLPQNIATNATPVFAAVAVGGTTLAGSGAATVTLPAITGTAVVTAGAQTVGGTKSFSSAVVVLADAGVQLNNAGNTFSTTLSAAAGLAQNTALRLPPDGGAAGNVLVGDGAGNLAYGVNGAALAKYYATALASASGAAFTTLYGAGTGSLTIPANTLVANSGVRAVLACSHVSGVGTSTYRVVLGGTTLVTSPALANVASTPMHIEVTVWVPSAGTALVSGTIVRGSAISVFTQPSPVAFNPAVANAFNIQVAFSSTATASCRGFMRVAPDLF